MLVDELSFMFEKGSRQVGSFRFVISNYDCLCYEVVVEDDVCVQ